MKLFATTSLATALLFAAPAFAQDATPAPADAPTPTAAPTEGAAAQTADGMEPVTVEMKNVDGGSAGTVTVTPTPHGLLLAADLSGLGDGERSFHLHETGVCEGDFSSAGGHYNPTDKEHGYMAENGPHAGDMPNFTATGGTAQFQTFNPMVTMSGGEAPLNDADGTSIVVHDGADDYTSQPAGDAGDRIACGVVFAAE
jgi:Cu-Zn family superoxide dismutase